MDKILFIHWNIYYNDNNEYYISNIQQLHLDLLKQHCAIFNKIIIVLHTKDIHDISTIHSVKVIFDKIFGNKITFYIEPLSNNDYIKTANTYYLPILNNSYKDTELLFYISDFGEVDDTKFDEHSNIIKEEYELNFNNMNTTLYNFVTSEYVLSCGKLYKFSDFFAANPIFGISPKNYRVYCMNCKIDESMRWNIQKIPTEHFFNIIPRDLIFSQNTLIY